MAALSALAGGGGCGGHGGLAVGDGVTVGTTDGSSEGPLGSTSSVAARDGASSDGSIAEHAAVGDGGIFIFLATGGPAGEVAAKARLIPPGYGDPGFAFAVIQPTCTQALVAGACELTSCEFVPGDLGPGFGNPGPLSATAGATTMALTYESHSYWYWDVAFPSSIALGEGSVMTFRGGNWNIDETGLDFRYVPAFEVSAVIPGIAVMTSPVQTPDGGPATVNTSEDLSVTWLPISIGQIHFSLDAYIPLPPSSTATAWISVACTFEGASGVVPRALLAQLKMMSGTTSAQASLSAELDVTTVVHGLTIVTQSYQYSPTAGRIINLSLE